MPLADAQVRVHENSRVVRALLTPSMVDFLKLERKTRSSSAKCNLTLGPSRSVRLPAAPNSMGPTAFLTHRQPQHRLVPPGGCGDTKVPKHLRQQHTLYGQTPSALDTKHTGGRETNPKRRWSTTRSHTLHFRGGFSCANDNDGARYDLCSCTIELQDAWHTTPVAGAHQVRVHEILRVVRLMFNFRLLGLPRLKA